MTDNIDKNCIQLRNRKIKRKSKSVSEIDYNAVSDTYDIHNKNLNSNLKNINQSIDFFFGSF